MTSFNYFLICVYLIHKKINTASCHPLTHHPQMKCSLHKWRATNEREQCVGSIPATPASSGDVSAGPSPRPARPRPQRGGCSPWLGSGRPRGLQPTPGRAPTQAARPPHRQRLRSCRRPSRPGSVYKRLLAVPLSNASPRQPGSQTRTHRVPAREDRPLLREEQAASQGLICLSHCFPSCLYHNAPPNAEMGVCTSSCHLDPTRTGSAISSCHG